MPVWTCSPDGFDGADTVFPVTPFDDCLRTFGYIPSRLIGLVINEATLHEDRRGFGIAQDIQPCGRFRPAVRIPSASEIAALTAAAFACPVLSPV